MTQINTPKLAESIKALQVKKVNQFKLRTNLVQTLVLYGYFGSNLIFIHDIHLIKVSLENNQIRIIVKKR